VLTQSHCMVVFSSWTAENSEVVFVQSERKEER
jgi:hypothetical protein